jgi:hypothetical protein
MTLLGEENADLQKKVPEIEISVDVKDNKAIVTFMRDENEKTPLFPKDFVLTIISRRNVKISPVSFEGKNDQEIPEFGSRGTAARLIFKFEKGILSAEGAEKAIVQFKGKQFEVDVNRAPNKIPHEKNK